MTVVQEVSTLCKSRDGRIWVVNGFLKSFKITMQILPIIQTGFHGVEGSRTVPSEEHDAHFVRADGLKSVLFVRGSVVSEEGKGFAPILPRGGDRTTEFVEEPAGKC